MQCLYKLQHQVITKRRIIFPFVQKDLADIGRDLKQFSCRKLYLLSKSNSIEMPEYVRRTISENHPRVICPVLEEGSVLPQGLSDEQRLCLTQGRLAKDFGMGIKIVKNP
jgi:hypothetical protein